MADQEQQDYGGFERRKSVFTEADKAFLLQMVRGPKEFKVFGLRVSEVTLIISAAFLLFAFYIRTNDMLAVLTEKQKYTDKFMENSDRYHSTVSGFSFHQGKPENPGYDAGSRIWELTHGNVKTYPANKN